MIRLADSFVRPDWHVSERVRAYVTTRTGGVSIAPYDSLNLATHVDDSPEAVIKNREILRDALQLPSEPLWLEQVHGTHVADSECEIECRADASYADWPEEICVVLTADCLPVFLADKDGHEVAVAHAGWKGLLNGVIEAALKKFKSPPENIHAWLGPAIGPKNFEVGGEVRQAFVDEAETFGDTAPWAFQQSSLSFPRRREPSDRRSQSIIQQTKEAFKVTADSENKYFANIYELARIRLNRIGVTNISGGDFCTVENKEMFYSYRRDGVTGRMASLIWIDE